MPTFRYHQCNVQSNLTQHSKIRLGPYFCNVGLGWIVQCWLKGKIHFNNFLNPSSVHHPDGRLPLQYSHGTYVDHNGRNALRELLEEIEEENNGTTT